MSTVLTQQTAVAMAIEVADIIVRRPFTFTAVPSHVENKLKLKVIDTDPDNGQLDITGYIDYACTVVEFKASCHKMLAEMVRDLKTKALYERRLGKLAS